MSRNIFAAVLAASRFTRRTRSTEVDTALTAGEQAELLQLQTSTRAAFAPFYFPNAAYYDEAIQGYRPDLLALGPAESLVSLPLPQLIGEITHVKGRLRAIRRPNREETDREALTMWCRHLAALKAEFGDRASYGNRPCLSELDLARIAAAERGVNDASNEYPVSLPYEVWQHLYPRIDSSYSSDAARSGPVATVHDQDLPTADQDAANEAAEQALSAVHSLYDQVNRPDIEWTEDGPQYAGTYNDGDDPKLAATVAAAETHFDDVLRKHRDVLSGMKQWQSHYQDLDAKTATEDSSAEQTEENEQ